MASLRNQLDTLSVTEVQDLATRLMVSLNKDMLVHLLIDMVDPRVMIENILKTKEDNDSLAETMREKNFPSLLVCYECVEIHNKLEVELNGVYHKLLLKLH